MTDMLKKQDKPNDPPYAGGEDETARNHQPDPPVDESDEGPGAASTDPTAAD